MPHKKLIPFSNDLIVCIQKDADDREISFTEMVRRILDRYYEDKYPEDQPRITKPEPRRVLDETLPPFAHKPVPRPGRVLDEGLLPQRKPL